jgi:4-amino-4-deoxy-L-arabinose transferase-like glycosyltransferase
MVEGGPSLRKGLATLAFRGAVALVAVLSLLPVADWIPGEPGSNLPPPHWPLYALWVLGLGIMVPLAWGAARLLGRRSTATAAGGAKAPPRAAPPERRRWRSAPWVLFGVAAFAYGATSLALFDGRPLHVDALTQAFQARIFADGKLSVPVADDPRFFSSALIVEHGGRAFSQFPPGWSALLAVGFLVGLPWLVAPLCGALAVVALHRLLEERGESAGTAFFTAALFGLSPWIAANAASWMSHVPTLCFILLGSAALVRGMREPSAALWSGLAGAALGMATLIRPLEGVAFGLPATVWVLARAWREPSGRRSLAGFAVGGALTVGALLAWNQVMHGSPTLFGFELQWGPQHRLGFHEAPWGPPHTFLRGLQLMNGYLLGLQLLFFDAPAPSVVLALGALLLARRLDALDRYLLTGCALVMMGYVAFWGEGHDLGPRYLIPLAPVVAIWTVRFGRLVAERTGSDLHRRWAHALVVFLLLSGWILGTPNRWFVYRQSDPLRRLDTTVLGLPSAQNALVFLPASWPLQVQARLRATGITRQEAQWLYYRVGLCKLDVALSHLQADGVTDPAQVMAALRPLAADSAKMVLDPYSGSPGDPYTGLSDADTAAVSLCGVRQYLEEQQGGYMILTVQAQRGPTWTGDGPIVAQDLHEENRRLLAAYPERQAYRLRPVRMRGTVRELTLEPLKPDSVERVWSEFERLQREASVSLPPRGR